MKVEEDASLLSKRMGHEEDTLSMNPRDTIPSAMTRMKKIYEF
jgi:hypothetical protein